MHLAARVQDPTSPGDCCFYYHRIDRQPAEEHQYLQPPQVVIGGRLNARREQTPRLVFDAEILPQRRRNPSSPLTLPAQNQFSTYFETRLIQLLTYFPSTPHIHTPLCPNFTSSTPACHWDEVYLSLPVCHATFYPFRLEVRL